jgi:hypothetical protein
MTNPADPFEVPDGNRQRRGNLKRGSVQALWLVVFLLLLLAPACQRVVSSVPAAAEELRDPCNSLRDQLPQEIEGFHRSASEPARCFCEDDLWEHLNGGAHEFSRLGFVWLLTAWYEDAPHGSRILIEIFCMKAPAAAHTAFQQFVFPQASVGSLCGASQIQGNIALFQRGHRFVRITAHYYDDRTVRVLATMVNELCRLMDE